MILNGRHIGKRHHLIVSEPHHRDTNIKLPVLRLFLRDGAAVYWPASDYLFSISAKSRTTHSMLPTILGLIWDCLIEADLPPASLKINKDVRDFLTSVVHFLHHGHRAIDTRGMEFSGLRWKSKSVEQVRNLCRAFDGFVSWSDGSAPPDDPFLQRCPGLFNGAFSLAVTANDFDAFRHVAHSRESQVAGRSARKKSTTVFEGLAAANAKKAPYLLSPKKRFPKEHLLPFLENAFSTGKGPEKRDKSGELTARLLVGSCRVSEYFNMFESDLEISHNRGLLGYLRHPAEFIEPTTGKSRRQLLEDRYDTVPRTERNDKYHAGFKSPALNNQYWSSIYWLAGSEDYILRSVVDYILSVRAPAMAARRERGDPDHPYLLVSPRTGDPYTLGAFRQSWRRAILRYSKGEDVPFDRMAKYLGNTIHAMRHLCGKTWINDGLSLSETQRILHHKSVVSTSVYTLADDNEVHEMIEVVRARMKSGELPEAFRKFSTSDESINAYVERSLGRGGRRY